MREVEAFLGPRRTTIRWLAEEVHKTKKLAVPKRIVQRLADRLAPQTVRPGPVRAGVAARPAAAPPPRPAEAAARARPTPPRVAPAGRIW